MRQWFQKLRMYIGPEKRAVSDTANDQSGLRTDATVPYVGQMVQRHELQRREEGKDFMLSRLNCTKF